MLKRGKKMDESPSVKEITQGGLNRVMLVTQLTAANCDAPV